MDENAELDELRNAYIGAVNEWVIAIREEEALASGDHFLAQVDKWEHAAFREDELREKTKAAKAEYESAIRQKFFSFR